MTYYTNSNQIKDVMTSIADVTVKPMDNSFEWTCSTLYIFDDLFRDRALSTYRVGHAEDAMTVKTLWEKRPEWGGMILEMMKNNQPVHLCVGGIDEWYRVLFYTCFEGEDFFEFIREKPPVLNAYRNCLISTEEYLSKEMNDAIVDLMEPMRFGQSMMRRLFQGQVASNKKAEFTGGDYPYLCYKLETLVNDVQHQRDLWKDRFFFQAMDADEDELCELCKEDMRRAFYDNCDEFEALRWRPGNGCGGVCKYCKRFIEELEDIKE